MYDVDMESLDDEVMISARKRTLSEHEAIVENQLKRLKINHRDVGQLSPLSSEPDESNHPIANGQIIDVDYSYVNRLLREMHMLREMRKMAAILRSPAHT
ncbi:hypothetical protein LEN26_016815 [Aphanomyces euteiches]|nr:hypothetical protein LEN26_016815 [Aphanomyces euteiches]KAH9129858.1 hypothetical protein AeMF1_000124 [Aphanomyces euteiches]KAH9197610.1 hypothetical protein AeNC1_000405 [Aphanomyces euteiches]